MAVLGRSRSGAPPDQILDPPLLRIGLQQLSRGLFLYGLFCIDIQTIKRTSVIIITEKSVAIHNTNMFSYSVLYTRIWNTLTTYNSHSTPEADKAV